MAYYTSSYALRQSRLSTSARPSKLKRNTNSVAFNGVKSGLGPISNAITLALILCLLGLLYLTQITKQTSYGYEVNELQAQKTELIEQQESLEVQAARLQAVERIQSSKVAKQLQQPSEVRYIQ